MTMIDYLVIGLGIAFGLSFFIGYTLCHYVVGPWILARHGVRPAVEGFVWFGNAMFVEQDLHELASKGIREARLTLSVISLAKWVIPLSFFGFIAIGVGRALWP